MRIENQLERRYGGTPDDFRTVVGVVQDTLGPEMTGDRRVVVASTLVTDFVQKKQFLKSNLVGRMAEAAGVDIGYLHTPSSAGVIAPDSVGRSSIFLTDIVYQPFHYFDKNNPTLRADLSNSSLLVSSVIANLLLKEQPVELPFSSHPDLLQYATEAIPQYLREQNAEDKDPDVEDFADEFEEFMKSNRDKISFTVQGFCVNVNLYDERVFSLLEQQDFAVRLLAIKGYLENFAATMRDRHPWFDPNIDIWKQFQETRIMQSSVRYLDKIVGSVSPDELVNLYKTSKLGELVGEQIVKELLIAKFEWDEEQVEMSGEGGEAGSFDELEEDTDYYLSGKQGRVELRQWQE